MGLLFLVGLCVLTPQPHRLRDPFRVHTVLRDPFDAAVIPEPELRDPFAPTGDLKDLPAPPMRHAELRIPDELR